MNGVDSFAHDPSFDLYGGGGIVSPVAELGGFLTAMFQGGVFQRPATLDTMIAARSAEMGGYGLGIFPLRVDGMRGYGHSGFWGTAAFHFPAEGLTVAVAVNEQSVGGGVYGLVGRVARELSRVRAAS